MILLIGKIIGCLAFSAIIGVIVDCFWHVFNQFANNTEVPDKPLRPTYIIKELKHCD